MIGAGAFGRFCYDAYSQSDDVTVIVVADPDPEALNQIDTSQVRVVRDWRDLMADDRVEAVHLATPPYLRLEMGLAALAVRKSVFCEKPLALSLTDADAIIGTARRVGAAISVDYVMRHHPAYLLLDALAASGLFGQLRAISLENYATAVPEGHWFWDPERSGGILVEHGVHFFDAYRRIAGEPVSVWGSVPRREAVEVTVEYASGAIGRYYHEFAFPEKVERTVGRSVFERGYVEIEGWIPTRLSASVLAPIERLQQVAARLGMRASAEQDGAAHLEASFPDRRAAYQAAILWGMRDVLHRHRDPNYHMTVQPEDARESLALAIAAQEAAATGRKVQLGSPHPDAVARQGP